MVGFCGVRLASYRGVNQVKALVRVETSVVELREKRVKVRRKDDGAQWTYSEIQVGQRFGLRTALILLLVANDAKT